jgi:hypothetical protein
VSNKINKQTIDLADFNELHDWAKIADDSVTYLEINGLPTSTVFGKKYNDYIFNSSEKSFDDSKELKANEIAQTITKKRIALSSFNLPSFGSRE